MRYLQGREDPVEDDEVVDSGPVDARPAADVALNDLIHVFARDKRSGRVEASWRSGRAIDVETERLVERRSPRVECAGQVGP